MSAEVEKLEKNLENVEYRGYNTRERVDDMQFYMWIGGMWLFVACSGKH